MRILYVLELYHPAIGGTETLFRSVIKASVDAGHEVHVITTRLPDMAAEEIIDGAAIHRVDCGSRYLFTIAALPTVLRYARRSDLIHTTSYNAALPAIIAGRWRKRPVVITFHEVWGELWHRLPYMSYISRQLHAGYERLLLRLPFHRFIAVSDYTRDRLQRYGVASDRITRIHNGISYDRWRVSPHEMPAAQSSVFNLLFYGRLGLSKGLDQFLPGLQLAIAAGAPLQLTMITSSPEEGIGPRLTSLIEKQGLSQHVSWMPQQSHEDLVRLIQQADAVVIPSYAEGFCFVAVETMALGTPIIHASRGALSEVIGGQHIMASDITPVAWRDALLSAYEGQWTSSPAKRWPVEITAEAYQSFYQSIIDERI